MKGRRAMGRQGVRVAVAICAGLLLLSQIAWACTAQPRIVNLIPLAARPGEEIQVSGQGVSPEMAPQDAGRNRQSSVEIRWNDVGGPSLATAHLDPQGNFSTRVVVPEAPAGIYTLVVAAGPSGIARAALEVIPSSSSPSQGRADAAQRAGSADLWEGFSREALREARQVSPPNAGISAGEPQPALAAGVALATAGAATLAAGALLGLKRTRRLSKSSGRN